MYTRRRKRKTPQWFKDGRKAMQEISYEETPPKMMRGDVYEMKGYLQSPKYHELSNQMLSMSERNIFYRHKHEHDDDKFVLSADIWYCIMKQLDFYTLATIRSVCKQFMQMASLDSLWRVHYKMVSCFNGTMHVGPVIPDRCNLSMNRNDDTTKCSSWWHYITCKPLVSENPRLNMARAKINYMLHTAHRISHLQYQKAKNEESNMITLIAFELCTNDATELIKKRKLVCDMLVTMLKDA